MADYSLLGSFSTGGASALSGDLLTKLKDADRESSLYYIDKSLENITGIDADTGDALDALGETDRMMIIKAQTMDLMSQMSIFDLNSSSANAFDAVSASTTGTAAVFDAVDVSGLEPGTNNVEITQLAQRDVFQSDSFNGAIKDTQLSPLGTTNNSETNTLDLDISLDENTGDPNNQAEYDIYQTELSYIANAGISIDLGGESYSFSIVSNPTSSTIEGLGAKTIDELADEINANEKLIASVESVGSDTYRLVIKSAESGLDNSIKISQNNVDLGFDNLIMNSLEVADKTAEIATGAVVIVNDHVFTGNEVQKITLGGIVNDTTVTDPVKAVYTLNLAGAKTNDNGDTLKFDNGSYGTYTESNGGSTDEEIASAMISEGTLEIDNIIYDVTAGSTSTEIILTAKTAVTEISDMTISVVDDSNEGGITQPNTSTQAITTDGVTGTNPTIDFLGTQVNTTQGADAATVVNDILTNKDIIISNWNDNNPKQLIKDIVADEDSASLQIIFDGATGDADDGNANEIALLDSKDISFTTSTTQEYEGAKTFENIISDINDGTDTLDVTATFIHSDPADLTSAGYIEIVSNDPTVDLIMSELESNLGFVNAGGTHVQTAQNLEANVDGVNYDVSDNTLTIQGNLTMTAVELGKSTINITKDTTTILSGVESFISSYNALIDLIDAEVADTDSPIYDMSSLKSITSEIKDKLFSSYGVNNDQNLFNYGLELDLQGHLSIDTGKFADGLVDNYNDIKNLFLGNTTDIDLAETDSTKYMGMGTLLTTYLDGLNGYDGLLSRYESSMTERQEKLEEDREKAIKALDSKYNALGAQYALYGSTISQMEASFSGMSMMIEQSTVSK